MFYIYIGSYMILIQEFFLLYTNIKISTYINRIQGIALLSDIGIQYTIVMILLIRISGVYTLCYMHNNIIYSYYNYYSIDT